MSCLSSPDHHRAGFTLLELLVALAILSIGLVAILGGLVSSVNLQKEAQKRYQAGLLLQSKLGQLVSSGYDGRHLHGTTLDSLYSWSVDGHLWQGPNDQTQANDGNAVQLIEAQVSVSWQGSRGKSLIEVVQLIKSRSNQENAQ